MEKIYRAMQELSALEMSFVLATVISRNGSAPRSTGAKMLVRSDQSIVGTVGGGILEAQVQSLAAQMFVEQAAVIRSFEFSGKDAATMDAICGGNVEVLIEWVDGRDSTTRQIINSLSDALENRRKSWLVTMMPNLTKTTTHILIAVDASLIGELPHGLTLESIQQTREVESPMIGSRRVVIEPVSIAGTAFIFGAGHVSQSLAEFVKAVGFWTVVLDDRPEFANKERFPNSDEIIVLDSYANLLEKISIDQNSFIVIVTRGHLNDRTVLAQVLKTNAGYIGMIGSRRKCELLYQELIKEGFAREDFARVHAPIGISISAETPEEIGISIVAEMIQTRALNTARQLEIK
ncbi:MAG: XdhC family aldehyde oxidoreductase maturation factor [Anaerolineaceae bacterium]